MELRIRRKKLASVLYMILILVHKSIELNIPREAFEAVQSSFLSKLGLRNRPMVDRSKVHIPQAMVEMYERQINGEYESTALPLPGRLTRSANTVRSYTHQGKCQRNYLLLLIFHFSFPLSRPLFAHSSNLLANQFSVIHGTMIVFLNEMMQWYRANE